MRVFGVVDWECPRLVVREAFGREGGRFIHRVARRCQTKPTSKHNTINHPSHPNQFKNHNHKKKERTDHQPIPQTLRTPAQHIPSHNQEPTPYPPYIPSTTPSHLSPPLPPPPPPPGPARHILHRRPGEVGGKQREVRLCRRGSCSSPCNIDTDKGWVSMRM